MVHDLPKAERSKWARDLPNLAKEWAAGLDKEGAQGSEMLKLLHGRDARRQAADRAPVGPRVRQAQHEPSVGAVRGRSGCEGAAHVFGA